MFGLFKKNPKKELQKRYEALLKKGMELQRGGDIKGYAAIMAQADDILKQIESLNS